VKIVFERQLVSLLCILFYLKLRIQTWLLTPLFSFAPFSFLAIVFHVVTAFGLSPLTFLLS